MTARQVVGYVRVSTEKQAEAGLSLEAQTVKLRAMAEVKGVALDAIFTDAGASAKTLDRPELTRLLALVDARAVGMVIVAKLDRLTRSLRDLCGLLDEFEDRGVGLVSIAESLDTRSSAGRLVVHIMGSVGDWERREIGTRTRDVLQHKRERGERVGTLPFGFELTLDPTGRRSKTGRMVLLVPAPVEQRILARMRELKATGASTRHIADDLNQRGWTTRRGGAWRFQYVARVMAKAS